MMEIVTPAVLWREGGDGFTTRTSEDPPARRFHSLSNDVSGRINTTGADGGGNKSKKAHAICT